MPSKPPQQQQSPTLSGPVGKQLVDMGAASGSLDPDAVGAAVLGTAGVVLSAAAIAAITKQVLDGARSFGAKLLVSQQQNLLSALLVAFPEKPRSFIDKLVEEEIGRERAFQAKLLARLQRDVPTALKLADADKRRARLQAILAREQRYIAMRMEAMNDRAIAAGNADTVREDSPQGAFWHLSPFVKEHTPDCIAMGGKFWPWSVLNEFHPPTHPGCQCQLVSANEAIDRGLMTPGHMDVDEGDAKARARDAMKLLKKIHEAGVTQDEFQAYLEEVTHHKGAMIALYPHRHAQRRLAAHPHATEPAHDVHLTLVFLGPDAEAIDDATLDKIRMAVAQAASESPPLSGQVGGIGAFHGDGTSHPLVALADVPGLNSLRANIAQKLDDAGVPYAKDHDFTPHLTLSYLAPGDMHPIATPVEAHPLDFDSIHVVKGGEHEVFPLGEPLTEALYDPAMHPKDRRGRWTWRVTGKPRDELLRRWARLDRDLMPYAGRPNHPKARKIIREQKAVVKAMHAANGEGTPKKGGAVRDVAVVGAGPAGIQAAIYGATEGLDTVLIDAEKKAGGQARLSERIENVMGFPAGIKGSQLAKEGFEQAERVGAEPHMGAKVEKLDYDPVSGLKTLKLSNGETIRARAVVIAGGVQFRHLNFPGSDSPDVIYGDTRELVKACRGKPIVIVGGANSAGQAALSAAKDSEHVTILLRHGQLSDKMSEYLVDQIQDDPKIDVKLGETESVQTDAHGRMTGVTLKDGTKLKAGALGLFIGSSPQTDWAQVARDEHGYVKVGEMGADQLETTIPGVFAAGDVRSGAIHRVASAIGDGAAAVTMIHGYLAHAHLSEAAVELFDPAKHPRGAHGKFAKAFAAAQAAGVDLRKAFEPTTQVPQGKMGYRVRGTAAIMDAHAEVPDAILSVPPEEKQRAELLAKLTTGNKERAFKEYAYTPVGDLEVLHHIDVANHPVFGQANTTPQRDVNMGSTSAMGDFRHELGHALRFAFSAPGPLTAHTPLTDYVSDLHAQALAKVKHNIAAGIPKPKTEPEWEKVIGVADPRALDSWEEDFGEQYRIYHRAVYRATHPEAADADPDAMKKYREMHPGWNRLWDAWYTAMAAGRSPDTIEEALNAGPESPHEQWMDKMYEYDQEHPFTGFEHHHHVVMTGAAIEEAVRYDVRYPKGTVEGGEFRPHLGGVVQDVKRDLLKDLAGQGLPSPGRRRYRRVRLHGRDVMIPENRNFRRRIGGHVYTSPVGSLKLYRDGKAYEPPAAMAAGGLEMPGPDTDALDKVAASVDAVRAEHEATIKAAITSALAARDVTLKPAIVGESGQMTDEALRRAGFVDVGMEGHKHGDHKGLVTFYYLGPDGRSRLTVKYSRGGGEVQDVSWIPVDPYDPGEELRRPPETWQEFTDDMTAYGMRMAKEHGRGATLTGRWRVNHEMTDHVAEHQWDGNVFVAPDIRSGVMSAIAQRKRTGGELSPDMKQGLYASTYSALHEALHGATPTGLASYDPTGPTGILEEALTEEIAPLETIKKLRMQGQHDVAQWAADNPEDYTRLGTYTAYRAALDDVMNEIHVAPEDREEFLYDLKFNVRPGDRMRTLATALAASRGIDPNNRAAIVELENEIGEHLVSVGQPSMPGDYSASNDPRFTPNLALDTIPSREPSRFEIAGAALHVGDGVTVNRHVPADVPGGYQIEPQAGHIEKLHDLPDGDWAADVRFPDTVEYGIAPSQILEAESPTDPESFRRSWGSRAGSVKIGDDVVHEGDVVSFDGRPDGGFSEARVLRILRAENPQVPEEGHEWALEAVTTANSLRPGQHVILTPSRVGHKLSLVEHQPVAAEPVSPTLEKRVAASKRFAMTEDTQLVPTHRLVSSQMADPREIAREVMHLNDPAGGNQRPPLTGLVRGDGRVDVLDGGAVIPAAEKVGLDHLPVRITGLSREAVLAQIGKVLSSYPRVEEVDTADRASARGQLQGFRDAARIISNGGGQDEIVDAAAEVEDAKPRHGEDDFSDAYQNAMRYVYGLLDPHVQRAHALLGRVETTGATGRAWPPRYGVAKVNPGMIDSDRISREFDQGVTWVAGTAMAKNPWLPKKKKGPTGEPLFDVDEEPYDKFADEDAKFAKYDKLMGLDDKPEKKVEPTPFQPMTLGKFDKALVRDESGKEWVASWSTAHNMMFLDPVGEPMAKTPIDVATLPPLMYLGKPKSSVTYSKPQPKWDDAHQIKTTGYAGGTNGAMIAEDEQGKKWFVKTYRGDQDRVATELLANAIYRKLGVPVVEAGQMSFDKKPALVYPLEPGEPGGGKSGLRVTTPSKALGKDFMVDALLANWDVIGLDHDNLLWPEGTKAGDMTPDLQPVRLDQGGTLQFRAQGQKKDFGPVPSEVWSMASPKGGQAFGTMALSDASKKAGAKRIAKVLTPQAIDELVDAAPFKSKKMRNEVREALKARVAWMGDYATGKVSEPQPLSGNAAILAARGANEKTTLRPEEHVALAEWEKGWNAQVNEFLRGGGTQKDASKELRFMVSEMDSLTRRAKVSSDMHAWFVLPGDAKGAPGMVGKTLTDKGFLEATTNEADATGEGVPVKLLIPEGSNAAVLAALPDSEVTDGRVVLPRNARVKIVGGDGSGLTAVLMPSGYGYGPSAPIAPKPKGGQGGSQPSWYSKVYGSGG